MNIDDAGTMTPCLVVERSKVIANCDRLRRRYAGRDIVLRPHLKTVKCYEAARLALPSPSGPATVSTLKEAEVFGRRGITDLMYAVGIAPQKLERVVALRTEGTDLKIVTDNVSAAEAIVDASAKSGVAIPTLIELDVDGHRSGVAAGDTAALLDIGRVLDKNGCLAGVMTHAGESYALSDAQALEQAAEDERSQTAAMAEALRQAGLPCPIVSIGSTPTAFSGRDTTGITEIRAGVYLFFDLCQAGIGVCDIDEIAISVLTTVIGHQHDKGWTIIDAGWMALSQDRSTSGQLVNQYLGLVCSADGIPFDDIVVILANQEHGIVSVRPGSGATMPDLPVGTRLRILPNHACATAAQHAAYQVLGDGHEIEATWPRFGGW